MADMVYASRVSGPIWSVTGLLLAVVDAMSARLGTVAVQGEIANFTRAASGHCYFSLKDGEGSGASVRCVMFRRQVQMLSMAPRDGLKVTLRGRLSIYEPRGELQMVVDTLQTQGAGSLYEEFLRLKAKLEAQGLFSVDRKRAVPLLPRAVGVVTSSSGAVWHDIMTTLRRRAPQVQLILYPSLVQGQDAPAALSRALQVANERAEVDVLLVCRGGGSIEDLWSFNDESVVRAIVASTLPVISGVGHETDVTLADLAADLRAPTPTAAAELVSPARDELLRDLQHLADRFGLRVHQRLDVQEQRLDHLSLRLKQPAQVLAVHTGRLDLLRQQLDARLKDFLQVSTQCLKDRGRRLLTAARTQTQLQQHGLAVREMRLRAMNPLAVLQRGYVLVEDSQGKPMLSSAALTVGERARAVWHDGAAWVRVEDVDKALAVKGHTSPASASD